MKYYLDTEFLDDGETIELVSVGVAAEDGRTYYAVSEDVSWGRVRKHPWLMANVWPHLPLNPMPSDSGRLHLDFNHPDVKPRETIAADLTGFFGENYIPRCGNELWAYYGAYDFVALCQLWGPMLATPEGVPKRINDLAQEAARLGVHTLPEQTTPKHHALNDALHDWKIHRYLESLAPTPWR
jgi:hypothetical protein